MAIFLDAKASDFEARFVELLAAKRETAADVDATVAEIIAAVRARGDAALAGIFPAFRPRRCFAPGFEDYAEQVDAALSACDPKAIEAPGKIRPTSGCSTLSSPPGPG